VRTDYADYIVGFDHRREGGSYLVRYEDGDLLHFPARELDTYLNYHVHIQNCAPPPERAQEHGNVLFAGFTPVPNTYATTVKQAGGFIFLDQLSRENHLFQLRDNRLPTSVPARNTHCLIVNTTKLVLSLYPLFPPGSNERETLRQFVHFLPQLLHAARLRHQDVESSSALIAQGKCTFCLRFSRKMAVFALICVGQSGADAQRGSPAIVRETLLTHISLPHVQILCNAQVAYRMVPRDARSCLTCSMICHG
jgi:hypothetical protein